MAKKRQRARLHGSVVKRTPGRKKKRSYEVPLLWMGALALIGFPLLREATSDRMQRNRYAERSSCECDYAPQQCRFDANAWVGPWYALDAAKRRADDPGAGRCSSGPAVSGRGGYVPHAYASTGYRGPIQVESGYRGGFGGTGRVRMAGS